MKGYANIRFIKIYGATVYIHWSSLVLIGGILAFSFQYPIFAVVSVASYLGMILLHEIGHALFARNLGYQTYNIYLSFFHGLCEMEAPGSPRDEAIVAWGGVIAQFVVAIPLLIAAQTTNISGVPGFGPVVAFLGYISALVALVNLAPSAFLDGGKAWALIPMLLKKRQRRELSARQKAAKKGIRIIK